VIRAEIVYFETVAGGAVFSTGLDSPSAAASRTAITITNVSRMLENVLPPLRWINVLQVGAGRRFWPRRWRRMPSAARITVVHRDQEGADRGDRRLDLQV